MIAIIKSGKDKTYNTKCLCGCEFSYQREDVLSNGKDYSLVECPECGKKNTVSKSFVIDNRNYKHKETGDDEDKLTLEEVSLINRALDEYFKCYEETMSYHFSTRRKISNILKERASRISF